jgi:hypothetical protein
MKKYYLVVSEHRSVANTKVHTHSTKYYEFDLLDLLSVKFYVMFIQFLVVYFKMKFEVIKLRYEHKKQRRILRKAVNQTAKSVKKKTTKYYNPYFNIGKMIEHDQENPMSYKEPVTHKAKQHKKIKNG